MLLTRAYTYFIKELSVVFLVVFAILLVLSLGDRFMGYLQEAAAGKISADGLWYLMLLRIPEFIQMVIPFGLLVSVLIVVGRLHAEQEFVVFVMAHVGPVRVVLWVMTIAIPLAALVAYLSLVIGPSARMAFVDEMVNQKVLSELDVVIPGEFRTFSDGSRVSYVEGVNRDEQVILGLFMNDSSEERQNSVVANTARFHFDPSDGGKFLELVDGRRYVGEPGTSLYQVVEFDRMQQRMEVGRADVIRHEPSAIPTHRLGMDRPDEAAEWHWRLALPILTLMMGFCGLAISKVKPRSGRFVMVVPGLCLFVLYYVLILATQYLQSNHSDLLVLGLWPVHLLFLAFGIYFTRRSWLPA